MFNNYLLLSYLYCVFVCMLDKFFLFLLFFLMPAAFTVFYYLPGLHYSLFTDKIHVERDKYESK